MSETPFKRVTYVVLVDVVLDMEDAYDKKAFPHYLNTAGSVPGEWVEISVREANYVIVAALVQDHHDGGR